jgi:LmbE family N-acetylglucosaminyl deacetylase
MKVIVARRIALSPLLLFLLLSPLGAIPCFGVAPKQDKPPKIQRLMAVFAHPDDETMAGTLLAHYARQPNTVVYLVIVSNGEKGVTPNTKVPAGDQLAAVRVKEAECACRALGAQAPILLGMPDGGLNNSRILAELASKLRNTVAEIAPDAIVTWGPDGGYGNPDHRLVSAVITQVVQEIGKPQLFYAGLPKSRIPESISGLRFPAPFAATADQFMDTRIPISEEDERIARRSLACHESQFTPKSIDQIRSITEKIDGGVVYLRSWSGRSARQDLFE